MIEAVQIAMPDRAHQRRAFEQVVARGREQAAFGNRAAPVARTSDALQRHGNRARRIDLADQVDSADIDAEFQRAVATSTLISPFFSFLSAARRSLRDRLPWCAATLSSPMRSPR